MKRLILLIAFSFMLALVFGQQKSWQGIHQSTIDKAQREFREPPVEFASHVIWGWDGDINKKVIQSDLDSIVKKGFKAVIIEAGYKMPFQYLSPEWFKMIKVAVLEAKKRKLKVWIIDEGKYPSGFAGGKFSKERPDLRMQALVLFKTIDLEENGSLKNQKIDTTIISAVAVSNSGARNRTIDIINHTISFDAGLDSWKILLVRPDFRTAVTRAVNNPAGGKDATNSLGDYLNPIAMQQFIDWTHAEYKKYLGSELGETVLGFRGDEPDYAHTPYTPKIIEVFKQEKGYDPSPYFASLFVSVPTEDEKRFKADYWDVWSEMFSNNFFKLQADWCEKNGVAHITHLNNEHNMPVCVKAEGDFFRALSKVQIPGVDAIWNQIWPDTINNFPKLASSVAHVYGKPRAFSESFAAYYTSPSIPQAKYVVDYQMVRGINFFEFMFWMSKSSRKNWMSDPQMKPLNEYTNRTTYLLAQGKPGARVAMYYPTSSFWLGNNTVDKNIRNLSQTLLEHQRDFDYVNDEAFFEIMTIGPGYFENKSGQRYHTLIIPSTDAISLKAWVKIEEFVERGGKLVFWGKKPYMLVDNSFTKPLAFPDFKQAWFEPSDNWSPTVAAAMPDAEVIIKSNKAQPESRRARTMVNLARDIRYTRRVLPDADIFFLFNEGKEVQSFTAKFDKVGMPMIWDSYTGKTHTIDYVISDDRTNITFEMQPYQSIVVSIKKADKEYDITTFGAVGDSTTLNTKAIQNAIDSAYANGGGCVVIPHGNFLSGALFFKQGVDLNMKKGSVLTSTVNPDDFPVISTRFEAKEQMWRCAFLNFDNSHGVRVFGDGTLVGCGVEWKAIAFGKTGRPRLICFTNCKAGSISGIHLRNQASWGLHVLYTDKFSITDVDIRAEHSIPSSDGIDIDSSNDIFISGAFIDVNDDCISIKSGRDEQGRRINRPSENIVIEKCHFAYGHGGVAMGSEVSGGIRNVMIRDCVMDADNWGPIRFKSQPSRGGIVENITFRDITLNGTRNAFDINMLWRMVPPIAPAAEKLTELKNIKIINVKGSTKSVGNINGMDTSPVTGIYFENCNIEAERGLKMTNVKDVNLEGLNIKVKQGKAIIN